MPDASNCIQTREPTIFWKLRGCFFPQVWFLVGSSARRSCQFLARTIENKTQNPISIPKMKDILKHILKQIQDHHSALACCSDAGHGFAQPPDCLLDDFTRKHLQQKLSREAGHADAVLQAVSALTVPSIAGVECNHAYIRRQKLSLEMSHTPSVHHASSLFVLAQHRKGLQTVAKSQIRKKRTWKALPKTKAGQTMGWRKLRGQRRGIEKTHGGGAWRIFLKNRMKGQHFSSVEEYQAELRRLPAEYRRLKQSDPQTFAKLRRQGLRATVAHRNTPRNPLESRRVAETAVPELLHSKGARAPSSSPWRCRTTDSSTHMVCHHVTTDVRSLSECVMCRMPAKDEEFFEDGWRQEHMLGGQEPSKLPRPPRPNPCRGAGLCLHVRPHLSSMCAKLTAALQKRFPPKTEQRALLRSGDVILELKVRTAQTGRSLTTAFAHVSYVQLQNPWKFTMLVLQKDDNPVQARHD